MYTHLVIIIISFDVCVCFYLGMFKPNDLLVAQDLLYKEKIPFTRVMAKYGRIFKCPITYVRVVDRLGIGRGPNVEILRGGLLTKYIVLRLTSIYNYPLAVNIYVGCENKMIVQTKPKSFTVSSTTAKSIEKSKQNIESVTIATTPSGAGSNITTIGGETTA